MGFDKDFSLIALDICQNDVNKAVQFLINQQHQIQSSNKQEQLSCSRDGVKKKENNLIYEYYAPSKLFEESASLPLFIRASYWFCCSF